MVTRRPAAALAIALVALVALPVLSGAAKPNKTFGITSKYSKSGATSLIAVKRPSGLVLDNGFNWLSAQRVGKWRGWGKAEVTAPAGKVRICEVSGKRLTKCSTAKGELTFDLLESRKCKLGKGKPKRRVHLYGRTYFKQDPTKKYPTGRGYAFQFGYPGEAAPCPKF